MLNQIYIVVCVPDSILQKDLEPIVIKILASIDVKVDSYMIAACHRLKTFNKKKSTSIILRFTNRKIALDY